MLLPALFVGMLAFASAQDNELFGKPTPPPVVTPTPKPEQKPASYWITYSQKVRPGHPMIFQVNIFEGKSPVDISIVLKGRGGKPILTNEPVSVMPGNPTSISVDIPLDIKRPSEDRYWDLQYTVDVSGEGVDMRFKNTGYATYQNKAFSIFVQTDKAMYKPSQKVQFRTLAMTPDMKVKKNVMQDIVVMDSKGNRILQMKGMNASETMGVFQKSFNLASSVPLGTWKIMVTIEGVEEMKEFEVSDYVLPRFEVEIDGSPYGIADDIIYECTVKAKYTFGKPVTEGKATVEIRLESWTNRPIIPIMRTGTLNSNGEMKVQVTISDLTALAQQYQTYKVDNLSWKTFVISANVTERRTGKLQTKSHNVQFYSSPIKIDFLGISPKSFKSGLDYTAYIEVTKQDGSLFSPEESKFIDVMVNVTYSMPRLPTPTTPSPTKEPPTKTPLPSRPPSKKPPGKSPPTTIAPTFSPRIASDEYYPPGGYYPRTETHNLTLDKSVYSVPDSGWIVVTFRVPEEARDISLRATTVSPFPKARTYYSANKARSPTNSFLQMNIINKKPKVGDTVRVEAKATDSMKVLNYQVFSKGLLLIADMATSSKGPSRTLSFDFQATASMSPSMSIVAFYVKDDGEFVVDALSLSVEGLFNNAVSLEFSKQQVQPGDKVDLIVKGEEESVVFLLAVDKSVKLLKSGNDITQEMVREELASYDFGNYGFWRYMFVCGWPSYFGGSDASSVFQNAGVGVMTDGLLYNMYEDGDYLYEKGPAATSMPILPEGDLAEVGLGGADNKQKAAISVRKSFPENWLWKITTIVPNSGGQVIIPLIAPDTITSWVASVFSANPYTGLSVAAEPAEVITFRNMFISLDLPSSIVRHEDFCFPASVFSYYKGDIPILLTLDQNPDFSNIWAKYENGNITLEKDELNFSHFIGFMRENEVKSLTFCFTPKVIGTITIRVTAITDVEGLSDSVERKLHVKPEGFPRATAVPYLVELQEGAWSKDVAMRFPTDTVEGSERISVNIAGNLLGPIFDNLDDLLKQPYGCGEQNMINFSPIMSLLDFFFTTNTITDEILEKGVDYMLIGYQKEILYEHGMSGGYSTFGNSDSTTENPSMWLTAFVTKCFAQAEYLDIKYKNILALDTNLILRSAKWMLSQQTRAGSFMENGRVFNKRLQGGSSKGVALSAYTVIALHHALEISEEFDNSSVSRISSGLMRAVRYLETRINQLDDAYDVCITAYALNLVGSRQSNAIFAVMESMAKRGSGMTYWARPKEQKPNNYWWSRNSDAISIEMTSYALLTYSLRGIGTTLGLPIVRWLSQQKGENGGFISTQDTVIGIEALTSVAKKLYGADFVPMTVTVKSVDALSQAQSFDFQITKATEMLLQRKEIPYQAGGKIQISAQTTGVVDASKSTVLVDVVFKYNVESETQGNIYDMYHRIETTNEGFEFSVKIWTIDGTNASMSILEVEIPAGFSPDYEAIKKINPVISKTDEKEDHLNVYINSDVIDGVGIKVKIPMVKGGGTLTKSKAKSYKVYNYYEPEMELTKKYFLDQSGDFCSKVPDFGVCQYV